VVAGTAAGADTSGLGKQIVVIDGADAKDDAQQA
jgi:hypothetical protein